MRAVVFDLDGTLTDPREGITRSIAYALERMGLAPPPLDELLFAIGPPMRASLARLIKSDSAPAVEQALAYYRERFATVGLFENQPYEGIEETLGALADAGTPLFVATLKPGIYARRIVEHFGLSRHFVDVQGPGLDGTRENKRDLLSDLIARHALDPAATAMVGDRDVDMIAARHHGVRAIGALWGYGSRAEREGAGAHDLCAAPRDLAALLR